MIASTSFLADGGTWRVVFGLSGQFGRRPRGSLCVAQEAGPFSYIFLPCYVQRPGSPGPEVRAMAPCSIILAAMDRMDLCSGGRFCGLVASSMLAHRVVAVVKTGGCEATIPSNGKPSASASGTCCPSGPRCRTLQRAWVQVQFVTIPAQVAVTSAIQSAVAGRNFDWRRAFRCQACSSASPGDPVEVRWTVPPGEQVDTAGFSLASGGTPANGARCIKDSKTQGQRPAVQATDQNRLAGFSAPLFTILPH